jgi:hypothetical protein
MNARVIVNFCGNLLSKVTFPAGCPKIINLINQISEKLSFSSFRFAKIPPILIQIVVFSNDVRELPKVFTQEIKGLGEFTPT